MVKGEEPGTGSARAVVRGHALVTAGRKAQPAHVRHVARAPEPADRAAELSARAGEPADRATLRPIVVKIGGRALEGPEATSELAAEITHFPGELVLVHGGGAEVSTWSARLGIEPRFVGGLRVTDPATLEVAAAVLAGLANKRLVASLRATGVDAVGLAALDGGVVEAAPHPDAARLGEVGTVQTVHPNLIEALLARGQTPVLSSIGDADGRLLNLNADDLAAALAGALHARALVLLSDVPGVILGHAVAESLDLASLERAIASAEVSGGMSAKLRAARAALSEGVPRVHIGAWSGPGTLRALLAGAGGGTTLVTQAGAAGNRAADAALEVSRE